MFPRRKIWMDGKLVPFNRAQVHVLSHSFCRGSAVFEVMSVHDTNRGPAVFRLDDHVRRLKQSAKLVRMKLPLSMKAIKDAVIETVRANKVSNGMIKLICYFGGVEFEVVPRNPEVSVMVVALDLDRDFEGLKYKSGGRPAQVTISDWRKIDPRTAPVECKCAANYLGGMIAKIDAVDHGFTAPVLVDVNGYLAEGATESLFIIKNRTIKTPELGNILAGITRRTILEIARDINIKTVEKKLRPVELYEADEAFFTSSVVKTWSISRVDHVELDAPGEITRLLDKVIEKIVAGKVRDYNKWLNPAK